MIDYRRLTGWQFGEIEHRYAAKDTILYALGAGLGLDPCDAAQLRFVYEPDLVALPTMATVLGYPGFFLRNPDFGIDWKRVVLAEQGLTLHRPVPVAGAVVGRTRISRIVDKGPDKGALLYIEREVADLASGAPIATLLQVNFARGDGGYSRSGQPSDHPPPAPPAVPAAPPDAVVALPTSPQTALIYRLSGDLNPVHADPAVARAAGFDRPILDGMAAYAIAGHAILRKFCDYRTERLRSLRVRFSSPIYPGETLRVELWKRGGDVSFRASVVDRDLVVLDNGAAEVS